MNLGGSKNLFRHKSTNSARNSLLVSFSDLPAQELSSSHQLDNLQPWSPSMHQASCPEAVATGASTHHFAQGNPDRNTERICAHVEGAAQAPLPSRRSRKSRLKGLLDESCQHVSTEREKSVRAETIAGDKRKFRPRAIKLLSLQDSCRV